MYLWVFVSATMCTPHQFRIAIRGFQPGRPGRRASGPELWTALGSLSSTRGSSAHMTFPHAHEPFVRQAGTVAAQARRDGNQPFGALLVVDGDVVLTAMNSVGADRDPTAHAETNLMAKAIRELPHDHIRRAVLYTSCEPCAMC